MMLRNYSVLQVVLGIALTVCCLLSVSVPASQIQLEIPAKGTTAWDNLRYLALNVYHEARGERLECQFLVAAVTINRVNDKRWPNTVKEVVLSPRQFSWTNGKVPAVTDEKAWMLSLYVASKALNGFTKGMTDSLWYHTHQVNPSWNKLLIPAETCDNHVFWMDGV